MFQCVAERCATNRSTAWWYRINFARTASKSFPVDLYRSAVVAAIHLFPLWRGAGKRRCGHGAEAVEHQREIAPAQLGGALLVADANRLELLKQQGQVADLDLRPQRARGLCTIEELLG